MTWKSCKLVIIIGAAALMLSGCKNGSFFKKDNPNNGMNMNGSMLPPPVMNPQGGIESSVLPEPIRGQQAVESAEMKRIYFTFDSAELLGPAKEQLDQNAQYLKSNPGTQIQIEGHCDSRGTADYNYSLGQRRADVTRNYLIQQGVNPERLHTISYGADRPDDPAENEMAWARNRRAQFMVYGQQ